MKRVLFTLTLFFYSLGFYAQSEDDLPFESGTFYVEIHSVKEDAAPTINNTFFVENRVSKRHPSERSEFIYDKKRGLKVVLLSEEEVQEGKRVPRFLIVK